MGRKSSAPIAVVVVIASCLACSILRPRRAKTWRLTLEVGSTEREAVNRTVSVIEARLDAVGVRGYDVRQDNATTNRIVVDLPNLPDRERLKSLIAAQGKLELFEVVSLPSPIPIATYDTKEKANDFMKTLYGSTERHRVLPYVERSATGLPDNSTKWVIVRLPPIIDGADLRNAEAMPNRSGGDDYQIAFSLSKTGADKFGAWTGAHINEYIGVALNDEVKSIAFIESQISDSGEINGRFTKQAAEDLALVLRSGALPAPIKIVAEESIK